MHMAVRRPVLGWSPRGDVVKGVHESIILTSLRTPENNVWLPQFS